MVRRTKGLATTLAHTSTQSTQSWAPHFLLLPTPRVTKTARLAAWPCRLVIMAWITASRGGVAANHVVKPPTALCTKNEALRSLAPPKTSCRTLKTGNVGTSDCICTLLRPEASVPRMPLARHSFTHGGRGFSDERRHSGSLNCTDVHTLKKEARAVPGPRAAFWGLHAAEFRRRERARRGGARCTRSVRPIPDPNGVIRLSDVRPGQHRSPTGSWRRYHRGHCLTSPRPPRPPVASIANDEAASHRQSRRCGYTSIR